MNSSAKRFLILCAPSGAGKSTLCQAVLENFREFSLSVSSTTRSPRQYEKDGVHYHFVSKEKFEEKIRQNELLEHVHILGNYYGTDRKVCDEALQQGKFLVLDIDIQGAERIQELFPANTVAIFIEPPSLEELKKRLQARKSETEASIQQRINLANQEMQKAHHFPYRLKNDILQEAKLNLFKIIQKEMGLTPGKS